MKYLLHSLLIVAGFCLLGCGAEEPDERFQLNITAEVAHANSMRSLLESLSTQLKSEGINALKTELSFVEEQFEEFQSDDVGETHRGTYDTIMTQLKQLRDDVDSGKASPSAAAEALQGMLSLAEALPKGDEQATAAN